MLLSRAPLALLFALSVLFAGCGSGGGSSSPTGAPAENDSALAGKTFYSISAAEIGVIDLQEHGEATVTRTVVALNQTEQVDAQWQLANSTLSVDIGSEHREFGIDGNGNALTEGELHWEQIITPSAQLLTGDFWLSIPNHNPIQHFQFNADGSGVVYFYLSDQPASAAMQWQIEGKAVVVNYTNLNGSERFYVTGNPQPGHLSVIVFGGSLFSMYSYMAELIPFTPPISVAATAEQIAGRNFYGWLNDEQLLLTLEVDGSYHASIFTSSGNTESRDENGNWRLDGDGVLTLDFETGQRRLNAIMSQQPFLASGSYRLRVYDIVKNADVAGISWTTSEITFWFDADGTGFARMGSIDTGTKIPFTWQQQDQIEIHVVGQDINWVVTALNRNIGTLDVMQLTRGSTTYRSLDNLQFHHEQLPPADYTLVGGRRFYRLDSSKAELLQLQSNHWFETKMVSVGTDATSDDRGAWDIDDNGRITLAGQQPTRTLTAVNVAGAARLQFGSSTYYPLRANPSAADLIGQWQTANGIGNLLINSDGTGSIVSSWLSSPINFSWYIDGDHARMEYSVISSVVYDWYLTAPTQPGQAPSILQCTVSGDGCGELAFLPYVRQ